MKAVKTSVRNRLILSIGFLITMFLVHKLVIEQEFFFKPFLACSFIVILINFCWLQKTPEQMDEREKLELIKVNSSMFNITSTLVGCVFIIHLIWYQQMTIIEFALFSMLPASIYFSIRMFKLNRLMTE